MCPSNRNNLISDKIIRLPTLAAIVRRAHRAFLMASETVAANSHPRLLRNADDTLGTKLGVPRRLGRLRRSRLTTPGDAADQGSAKSRGERPLRDTQSPTIGSLVGEPSRRLATWSRALGAISTDRVTAVDIRLTLSIPPGSDDLKLRGRALPEPAAAAQAGELLPWLRSLLTDSAGTIANVAHQLETRAAEIDNDARAQLQDDISVLEDELDAAKGLLGNSVDWDAEAKRLFDGEIPPLEWDDDE